MRAAIANGRDTKQATELAFEVLERSGWKFRWPGSTELVREFQSCAGRHCAYVRVEPHTGSAVLLSTALKRDGEDGEIGQSSVIEIQHDATVRQVQESVHCLTQALLKSVGQKLASMLLKDFGQHCCN